ncbi:hypothetical protein CEXT_386861 [Caerostris extrusa]|uniref:Uncharacterized protein n=1 Tax=Caerostris extrusa TaxID=172846 RepID=A0AAV4NKW7_CAEEX|nr:hypothetical protein CEXT_386861 [Caerostris extrusa]
MDNFYLPVVFHLKELKTRHSQKTHFIVPFSKTLVNDTSRVPWNSVPNSVFQFIPKTYDESLMSPKVVQHLPKHFTLSSVIDIFHGICFEKSVRRWKGWGWNVRKGGGGYASSSFPPQAQQNSSPDLMCSSSPIGTQSSVGKIPNQVSCSWKTIILSTRQNQEEVTLPCTDGCLLMHKNRYSQPGRPLVQYIKCNT